ncbi:hypothetical protein HGB07_02750 [Candidatus Roizmanbacteria bacterium]|nr:hypothetical protein [Candidatus Roizmanbacteria bacterium]
MDTTQLLLIIVLSLTTILLILVGVQLFLVLRDIRATLVRVNRIIEGFENMGVGLDHGIGEVIGFVNGFKTLLKTFDLINHKKHEKSK